MKLPKVNQEESKESLSINKLKLLLGSELFEIRDVAFRDKGVDLVVEIKKDGSYSGFDLFVQVKATSSIKTNKDASYSKSIETSNLNYLINKGETSIYILYVLEKDKFYFEWAVEFYLGIKHKIEDYEDQESHTLRFKKELSIDVISNIHEKVYNRGLERRRELENKIDFVPITLSTKDENKSIFDSLFDLTENFSPLVVLPPHLFSSIYPISIDSNSYISGTSLYTDNDELYTLFDSFEIKGNNIVLKENNQFGFEIDESKLKQVVRFFQINYIEHLYLLDSRKSPICIHKIKTQDPICECGVCLFDRIEWEKGFGKVNEDTAEDNEVYEAIKNAYVQYQYGNLKAAFNKFKNLAIQLNSKQKFVGYFICSYNLSKLFITIKRHYWQEDRREIIDYLKEVDLDNILWELRPNLTVEVFQLLKWIKEDKFIYSRFWNLEDIVPNTIKHFISDQKGGWSSHNQSYRLLVQLARLKGFIDFNLVLYDNFSEVTDLVNKAFEGFVALYSINNKLSSRYENFDNLIVRLILHYGDYEVVDRHINRYNVNQIKFSSEKDEISFYKRIINFFEAKEIIMGIVGADKNNTNSFYRQKVNRLFKNILLILTRFEFDVSRLNDCVTQLISFISESSFINPVNFRFINPLIRLKGDAFTEEKLQHLLFLTFEVKTFKNIDRLALTNLIKSKNVKYFLNLDSLVNPSELMNVEGLNLKIGLSDLILIQDLLAEKDKNNLKDSIKEELDLKFNPDLYYDAVINDIIDYEFYFEKYLFSVAQSNKGETFREIFAGIKDYQNYRLDQLINLAFKLDLDLKEERFQTLHGSIPYYEWLMNLDTFDYSKFDVYWIMVHPTIYYLEKFKKHTKIRLAIKEAMNKKFIDGVAKIYFKYFIE